MTKQTYDVIIIGGGIMGSAVGYSLVREDPSLRVAVVERDPSYTRASTTLSMSNARVQFSLKQNIQISQYAFKILERFEEEMTVDDVKPSISLKREGNLFLHAESSLPAAEDAYRLQQSLGCPVEWWSPEEVRRRYPLYEPRGIAAGSFGPMDGHFDAYAVLMGYRRKARALGADYLEDEVVTIRATRGRVTGVDLSSGIALSSGIIINCAGAWCSEIAKTAGVLLPIQPVMRQVFVLDPAAKPKGPLPLTVLPSGLYFRTETGGVILLGKSMAEDTVGFDFIWDERRFLDHLWFELAEFVPTFDTLKLIRGWAGLYAVNTLDANAVLGEWPELGGLYLANGFSGHGLQQAPAVSRYLMELILKRPHALDLSHFKPDRILRGIRINEVGLV